MSYSTAATRQVAAGASEYFALGPLKPDTVLSAVNVVVASSNAHTHAISLGLSKTNDANAAALQAAIPLIPLGDHVVDTHPYLTLAQAASASATFTLHPHRRLSAGPTWLLVRYAPSPIGTDGFICVEAVCDDILRLPTATVAPGRQAPPSPGELGPPTPEPIGIPYSIET